MLKITQQQMATLSRLRVQDFEDRMVQHVRVANSQRCAVLGDSRIRDMVRSGIGRAASHGITIERDVCRFIELMCTLGETFDSDPRYPWTREILKKGRFRSPSVMMDRLYAEASEQVPRTDEEARSDEQTDGAGAAPAGADTSPQAAEVQFSGITPIGKLIIPCPRRVVLFSM